MSDTPTTTAPVVTYLDETLGPDSTRVDADFALQDLLATMQAFAGLPSRRRRGASATRSS